MARQSVPDDQQLAGNVAQQVLQKLDDLRAADRPRKQAEVEIPPRHSRHRRQHLPVEVIVRRGKALDFRGCNSRPGTGSLHPVTIETAAEATKLSELSM